MSKILFVPFRVLSGLLAGLIGKKLFEGLWSLLQREEPPDPKHRDVPWRKLVPALLLEGAIFRAVRGIVDRASRQGFSKATGSGPGERRPKEGCAARRSPLPESPALPRQEHEPSRRSHQPHR